MNKNTARLNRLCRAERKSGNSSLTISRPSDGYHNSPKGAFSPVTIPLPVGRSENLGRNMEQVILKNTNGDGGKDSLTVHRPIYPNKSFRPYRRHKLTVDDKGKVVGLGLSHPWTHPESSLGRLATVQLG